MKYKSIIIASPSRSGSTWTLNILKEIYINQKMNVIPQKVLRNDEDSLKYHFKNIAEGKKDTISIIKVEKILKKEDMKNTKIIINFRDPRDAYISFYNFMGYKKFKFDYMLRWINDFINSIEHHRKIFTKEQLLEINFPDINNCPLKILEQFESFLKLKIEKKTANEIINKFSKNKVSDIIKKKENEIRKDFENKKDINKDDVIVEDYKIVRVYDAKTGFQTGHIAKYKEGDWEKYLSKMEISILNNNFRKWFKLNNLSN